jgi:proteasome lid subunit RPN8/RPN11
LKQVVEQYWTLIGERRGRIWYMRRIGHRTGGPASVTFDGPGVLRREEERRDVLGFMHTHPDGPAQPSARDVLTMRAWCSAFGKPLMCAIACPQTLAAFRFDPDSPDGIPFAEIELFPRGTVIGVERDG